ncbi:MAG: AbiU2 domain-containing protein, partial [Nostoc sp.]
MNVIIADFESKIVALGNSLEQSRSHLKLSEWIKYKYINKYLKDYPSFYRLSYTANYEIGLLKLSRVYDEREGCLSLLKCLKIFDSHHKKWGLTNVNRVILEQDKKDVSSKNNSLVNRLKHLRDKTLAHTDNKLYPLP